MQLQFDPNKSALEEIGILCDGIDKSEAVGSEFGGSSNTLELYHAKDVLTTSLSQLAIILTSRKQVQLMYLLSICLTWFHIGIL